MASYFMVDSEIMVAPGKRFLNRLIDVIILWVFSALLTFLARLMRDFGAEWLFRALNSGWFISYLVESVMGCCYYFIMEALTGRTIGKMATGTIVVNEFGERPTAQQIEVRSLCRMIPFNAFSFFGTPSRGWHDSIPNTYVVDAQMLKDAKLLRNDFEQIGQEQL